MDNVFMEKKARLLAGYVEKLQRLTEGHSAAELRNDEMRLDAVERNFRLVVDTMVDINTHILKTGNFGDVDDLQSTFTALGDVGVLEKDFAAKVAPIVGVRNMLIPRYEKLDKDLFLSNLKNNFSDFRVYIVQIGEYIEHAGQQ